MWSYAFGVSGLTPHATRGEYKHGLITDIILSRPTPADAAPDRNGPFAGKPGQTRPALATPRPLSLSIPYSPCAAAESRSEIYISCRAALTLLLYRNILWLAKVKKPSPSATISLKDCPKSVFRQAPSPTFLDRYSIDLQSLFGVPGDFNLGESFTCLILSNYADSHSGFLVCFAAFIYALPP